MRSEEEKIAKSRNEISIYIENLKDLDKNVEVFFGSSSCITTLARDQILITF
jgi:hypothetical protein